MVQVVIMNGYPESGKTTFEDMCIEILGPYGSKISTIDCIKQIAKLAGWDGCKTPESRKYLSDLKDLLTQWTDYSFKTVEAHCRSKQFELEQFDIGSANAVVFVDSREPSEIERFEREMGAASVLIRRPGDVEQHHSNHADSEVLNHKYSYIINNDGSLEELQLKAARFVDDLKQLIEKKKTEEEKR